MSKKAVQENSHSRRSRSSVLEDLALKIKTRSTNRTHPIQKELPIRKPLSQFERFIAELEQSEDQTSDPEPSSERSIESDYIVWDERSSPSSQPPVLEYSSPINSRTRSKRRNLEIKRYPKREQRPTNPLLSSIWDFTADLNKSDGDPSRNEGLRVQEEYVLLISPKSTGGPNWPGGRSILVDFEGGTSD